MQIERVAGVAGMCLMMGCGESSTSPLEATFPAQFVGFPGAVSYDETNDTITISSRIYNSRVEPFLPEGINGYKTSVNIFPVSEYTIRGVTPSGAGVAVSYLEREGTLERIGTTSFTPAGQVTYTGDYVGIFSSDGNNTSAGAAYVLGDAELIMRFDDGLFSFFITNRRGFQGTQSHSDTGINGAIGEDGTFSGSISSGVDGAVLGHQRVNSLEKNVSGIIVGGNGEEAVGTFDFSYRHGADQDFYFENGVWVVTR